MFKGKSGKVSVSIILLCILFVSAVACSTTEVIPSSPTQTQGASAGDNQNDLTPIGMCPTRATRYLITYFHFQHLKIDPGTGETIELTWDNSEDPGEIRVWIDEMGNITPYEGNENIDVTVTGKAIHPDDDNCPVQKFSGEWELSTMLTGDCTDGKATIIIKHLWDEADLENSCADTPPMVQEYYSAPEHILVFKLSDEIPSEIIEIGEGTFYHMRYAYYFTADENYLEDIPTLAPGSE